MSGLLALLDDVAAIAKITAASIDDVAAQTVKAGSKAAGLIIDDAAVTPKYVTGLAASRELPMIWEITKGSIRNKIIILLPILLILNYFVPAIITPILMVGGAYLCFEGAEKVVHWLKPHHVEYVETSHDVGDAARLERERVKGAITTDFILSAEIMVISLSVITATSIWMEALILGLVGILITAVVYGGVALIVKADDAGVALVKHGRTPISRGMGHALVKGMPYFLSVLSFVGTLAMLWVGGDILIHGLSTMGYTPPYAWLNSVAASVSAIMPAALAGFVGWLTKAAISGVIGLIVGLILIPIVTKILVPLWSAVTGKKVAH